MGVWQVAICRRPGRRLRVDGQSLDPQAVRAAVIAHIRHVHTDYDALLMQGVARRAARDRIQARVQEVVETWSRG